LILQKLRFVIACPFLLAGIGFVLLGRVVLTRRDRLEFDKHYFGMPEKRPRTTEDRRSLC
jgi:hypothetical protein